jgi:hypothetical protein
MLPRVDGPATNPIEYARPGVGPPRPTRHSPLAGLAWATLIVETLYRGTVAAIAHHRSPTYPWGRFSRNVGNPEVFIDIDQCLLMLGVILATLALLHPYRKRWAALAALAAHVTVLIVKYDVGLSLSRH